MNELEELRQENAALKKRLEVYENEDDKSVFASRLQQARKMTGITQKKLAELIGVSVNSCIGYENSRREPQLSRAVILADTLNVSIDWLCGRSEKMKLE